MGYGITKKYVDDKVAEVTTQFHVKDPVANYSSLPITGNGENDIRFVKDTDKGYVWSIASPTGSLTDWKEIGLTSVDWSLITGKPSSSVTNIDDAVTLKHTKNADTILDEGGVNEIGVAKITPRLTENINYYINPDTGSNDNPGTSALPFATIQKAINLLPKNLGYKSAVIYLQSSLNYTGKTEILGFYGGELRIRGVTTTPANALITSSDDGFYIRNCYAYIRIDYLSIKVTANSKKCINVVGSFRIRIDTVKYSDNNNIGTIGVYGDNSIIRVLNSSDYDDKKVAEGIKNNLGYITPDGSEFGDQWLSLASSGIISDDNKGVVFNGIDTIKAVYESEEDLKYLNIGEPSSGGFIRLFKKGGIYVARGSVEFQADYSENDEDAARFGFWTYNGEEGTDSILLMELFKNGKVYVPGFILVEGRINVGGNILLHGNLTDGDEENATSPAELKDAVNKKHSNSLDHTQNTDTGTSQNFDVVGEVSIKVYSQNEEPTLGANNRMAIWVDTNDSNRVYLLFKRGTGDQVLVELS